MSWIIRALASSVGKKFVMGITGLLLCGFLVTHLAGNLLLYVGPEAYNSYAHALHSKETLIKFAELGLVALFLVHIVLAVVTTFENRSARPVDYEKKETKKIGGVLIVAPDTWMFVSGAVVFGFLILHLTDFTFEYRSDDLYHDDTTGQSLEPFDKAKKLLANPTSCLVYIFGCLFLGFHLSHGFSSAFQSLGISHPKYDPWIKWLGILFAFVIAVGFMGFPIWAVATYESTQ